MLSFGHKVIILSLSKQSKHKKNLFILVCYLKVSDKKLKLSRCLILNKPFHLIINFMHDGKNHKSMFIYSTIIMLLILEVLCNIFTAYAPACFLKIFNSPFLTHFKYSQHTITIPIKPRLYSSIIAKTSSVKN